MFNGEYAQIPREDPSPSNPRSQTMSTVTTPNDPSASGPANGLPSNGTPNGFSAQHLLAPLIGTFQHSLPGGVYNGGPSQSNAMATPSSFQGGGGFPPILPYGGPPPTLPNVPNGQAGNLAASFQQVAAQPWRALHPDGVFARPNAQGIPGPLWQLFDVELDYEGGDEARVIVHFRKIQSL